MTFRPTFAFHRPERLALPAAGFVAWLYLSVVLILGIWLTVVMAVTGWKPVVITGGSMQPTLRVGDILLVEDHPDELIGQRSVITYEAGRSGGLVTHRVQEVLPESQAYVTKGDANPSVDTDTVRPGQVVGVAQLVVPALGLPVVWAQTGDWTALGALAVLSVGAIATALSTAARARKAIYAPSGRNSEMANRGIRRVRLLAGLMIVGTLYFDGADAADGGWGLDRNVVVLASAAVLLLVNLLSGMLGRRGEQPPEWAVLAELGVDTLLAVPLIALSNGSGVVWAFIALPIVEAAVRFQLAGALLHWVVMTVLTVGARLYALEQADASLATTVDELERLLDELGILLLLVIPGAYLTEQLVSDVLHQDWATGQAVERAKRLERVAETGYELNRLGSELFATLTSSVTDLGFDYGDAHLLSPDGEWRLLAASHPHLERAMPPPGEPGSGLRPPDLALAEVIVDRDDPEVSEVLALQAHDLSLVTRLTVSTEEGRHVVVRAAVRAGSAARTGGIDAIRLLTGQAAVALQNRQLVTELQDVQVELARQAHHDALTGLPNRAQFLHRLHEGLAGASDPNRRHAVMFMDLNGFKGINDTLGHEAGDALLTGVAGRLTRAVGDAGMVARLGGDEFTVLLEPAADIAPAVAVADRIHEALEAPFQLGECSVSVSGSIGIAPAELGLSGGEILRRADVAMYAAKSSKQTPRTSQYHASLDDRERRRGRLSAEFKKALDRHELTLVYQPIVAAGGQVRGVEALLRWTHRELGPVSTATILELAEVANRVDDLTAWIFNTALTDIAGCHIPSSQPFTVAVNVTPTELVSPRLITTVRESLAASGLPADSLIVELNERVASDGKASLASVQQMGALGIGLALDDFGEGRTSLGHLRNLPIGRLKLDRTLVQNATTGDADQVILSSVIRLAHDLDFVVVAEGIEKPTHLSTALAAGADLLQGFGLHRPMELDGLKRLLADQGLVATVVERMDRTDAAEVAR